jgi:hypothetical protein
MQILRMGRMIMGLQQALAVSATGLLLLWPMAGTAQQSPAGTAKQTKANDAAAAASRMADFFSKVGDQIYEDCIFDLSEEQLEVQRALIQAYIENGATSALARKLAVKQIRPPQLSAECEKIKGVPRGFAAAEPEAAPEPPQAPPATAAEKKAPAPAAPKADKKLAEKMPWDPAPKPGAAPAAAPSGPLVPTAPLPTILASKPVLPQWDCAPGVDFVSIQRNGYTRKLTGGEICNPFEDVVREVPKTATGFRLGYTIKTGRLFVLSSDASINGKTIAWAISGREVCRNNPDPDCIAAKAIGPLPPGEYSFNSNTASRVSFGPKTKRMVAGIYMTKLWNKERFSPAQLAGIKARGNIAIHVRLKGEMSEACLGLEPKGWTYVSGLIKDGRATGVNVYIDEPHPQLAENPPVIVASTFSLTSLFK